MIIGLDSTGHPTQLLHTAGIEVTCYDVDTRRMLITLQSGWRGFDVKDFLLGQTVVDEVEWDAVKYDRSGGQQQGAPPAMPPHAAVGGEEHPRRRAPSTKRAKKRAASPSGKSTVAGEVKRGSEKEEL